MNKREVGVVQHSRPKQSSKAPFADHLQPSQVTSSGHLPKYLNDKRMDTNEAVREKGGQLTTNMDLMGSNSKFEGFDRYPTEDSSDDDDDLYARVDHKKSDSISRKAIDKSALLNGGDTLDGLYSSVDDMGYDRKHNDSSISNLQNKLGNASKANSLKQNEQDSVAIYATVDKSNITPKQTNDYLKENEFEIPPPIPDKLFLDQEDFENNNPSIDTDCNGRDLKNIEIEVKNNFFSLETSRGENKGKFPRNTTLDTNKVPRNTVVYMGKVSGNTTVETDKVPRDTAVETNIASFSERLHKFNEKSSVAKGDRKEPIQKIKQKSKSNLSQVISCLK